MTPKQMALSQLARLALSTVSDLPTSERIAAYQLTATALQDTCPDLADLALSTARKLSQSAESEADLLNYEA